MKSALIAAALHCLGGCASQEALPDEIRIPAERLESERRLARDAGVLFSPSEVRREAIPVGAKNAADAYKTFFALAKGNKAFASIGAKYYDALPPSQTLEAKLSISRDLTSVDSQLNELIEGISTPYCDFKLDYSAGSSFMFPERSQLKLLAKVLVSRAVQSVDKGKYSNAEQDLSTALQVASHQYQAPDLISMFTGQATEGIVLGAILNMVKARPKDQELLRMAEAVLSSLETPRPLRYYIQTDSVQCLSLFDEIKAVGEVVKIFGSEEEKPIVSPKQDKYLKEWKSAWEVRYLEEIRKRLTAIPDDYDDIPSTVSRLNAIEAEFETKSSDLSYLLAVIVGDGVGSLQSIGTRIARNRVHLKYVQLLDYKRRTGAFPEDLATLGEVPIDPFDRKPIKYRITAVGFVIYSVGRDMVDNGGLKRKNSEERPENEQYDLVYAFP